MTLKMYETPAGNWDLDPVEWADSHPLKKFKEVPKSAGIRMIVQLTNDGDVIPPFKP
jgi:hypothetical protein